MRSNDDVCQASQRESPGIEIVIKELAILGRFIGIYVDCESGNLATSTGIDEGWDVDDATARGVDQVRALFHDVEFGAGDHVFGFGEFGHVERDEICLAEYIC